MIILAVLYFDVFKIFFSRFHIWPLHTTVLSIYAIFKFKYLCIRADISSMSVCKLLLAPGAILNKFSCEFGGFSLLIYKTQKSDCPLDSCRYGPFMDPFHQNSWPCFFTISQGGHVGRIWGETDFELGLPLVECPSEVTRWNFLSPFFFGFDNFFRLFHPLNDIGYHING